MNLAFAVTTGSSCSHTDPFGECSQAVPVSQSANGARYLKQRPLQSGNLPRLQNEKEIRVSHGGSMTAMTAPFSSIYRGLPQRWETEHNVTVEYDDFTTNVEYWVNGLAFPFDKSIAWDLSYVQKVMDYFLSCTTMQRWVEDITGALAKFRFALYARRHLLDMHQDSWAHGRRPSQMTIQFYFSSFIIMCRACLDALAVWLTYLFELEIDTPVNRDFSRPRFRNQIKEKSAKIYQKCCELQGWLKELTAYRDRVVHRDNLPKRTVRLCRCWV